MLHRSPPPSKCWNFLLSLMALPFGAMAGAGMGGVGTVEAAAAAAALAALAAGQAHPQNSASSLVTAASFRIQGRGGLLFIGTGA